MGGIKREENKKDNKKEEKERKTGEIKEDCRGGSE